MQAETYGWLAEILRWGSSIAGKADGIHAAQPPMHNSTWLLSSLPLLVSVQQRHQWTMRAAGAGLQTLIEKLAGTIPW